jgi:protein-disulfide isomerase
MTLRAACRSFLVAATIAIAAAFPAQAADPVFTPEQDAAIRALVHDYIMKNPEVIIESVNAMRARLAQSDEQRRVSVMRARAQELTMHPASPVAGNPKGDVTVVEFFDYRCPYCKRMVEPIAELLRTDRGVRYVFKELPILAPDSKIAARAALAAARQGKYLAVHNAFLAHRGSFDEATVVRIAGEHGVSRDRMLKDMKDPEIEAEIDRNQEFARALEITGTPTFVVGNLIMPGAVDLDQLREAIAQVRGKKN